jgi:hypothetical protein
MAALGYADLGKKRFRLRDALCAGASQHMHRRFDHVFQHRHVRP